MNKTKQLNEGIRVAKEGIEECWDDMGGQNMTQGNGEQMSVTISMPGKNISVTTDSADEIGNILRLAGITIGAEAQGMEPEVPAELPAAADEQDIVYVGAQSMGQSGAGEESPLTDNPGIEGNSGDSGNSGGEGHSGGNSGDGDSGEESEETDEATQTPSNWTDKQGNSHPATRVQGDRYGNDQEQQDDSNTNMYKKTPVPDEEEVDESSEILRLAGVTNEAQSAAQKAAFKAMIDKKNGGKSESKDDNKKPDADGDGVPDWADKDDKEVKENAPADSGSIFGQGVYEANRILELSGIEESRLMNAPDGTSMPEPKEYTIANKIGKGAGHKDYGQNRANNQGENPMGMHTADIDNVEEAFQSAMGEYRKFVAENIARKK
jgi:hypothetical protein